jgi:galacturan 1,4-alpha-galacturonidase
MEVELVGGMEKARTEERPSQNSFMPTHSLTSSTITGLNFLNSPVQLMSINGATTLTVSGLTMDNSAGDTDSLGHNTDAFDVGSSTGVTISGANM